MMLKPTAVLDTNVIYQLTCRDVLLWTATYKLFEPRWSAHILAEWESVMLRKGIEKPKAEKRVAVMTNAFRKATVLDYAHLIPTLQLPDPKDCHVLAAAITCKAHYIVTANLRDFPPAYLSLFGVQVMHPDAFLSGLIEVDSPRALEAFKSMVAQKKAPPVDAAGMLAQMRKAGLVRTVDALLKLL